MQAVRVALMAAALFSVAALVNMDAFARDGGRTASASSTTTATKTRLEAKLRNATNRAIEGEAEYRKEGTREREKLSVEGLDAALVGTVVTFFQTPTGGTRAQLGQATVKQTLTNEIEAEVEIDNLVTGVTITPLVAGALVEAVAADNTTVLASGNVKAK